VTNDYQEVIALQEIARNTNRIANALEALVASDRARQAIDRAFESIEEGAQHGREGTE